MRTCWINASVGSAGDMLLAALIDAGADQMAVISAWAALELDGYAATWERVDRQGVSALWTNLAIDDHDHKHDHHPHRPASDVIALIDGADLGADVKDNALAVYRRLAEVEGRVHGLPPDDVELHEVGALDSILDVVGVCAALDDLQISRLVYSPIAVGHGTIHTAHGVLPNPAPAVVHLLAGADAPTVGLDTTMELTTPTAAALLTVLGTPGPLPPMAVTATGFGAGTANPQGRANVVSIMVGHLASSENAADRALIDDALVVETNVDDVTGEVIAYTIERLLAIGAADAWATPIVMKKGRPAHTISAMCDLAQLDQMRSVLLTETGSLGARTYPIRRYPTSRTVTTVEVEGHRIRAKIADHRIKIEFDDAQAAAQALGRPVQEILAEAHNQAALGRSSSSHAGIDEASPST